MKRTIIIALLCSIVGVGTLFAQTKADTLKVQVKIKELKQTELTLKKKIEVEDKKRNQTISGVSEVSMDEINERQDSICLDLRSQLVDVQLQVRELELSLKPTVTITSEQAAANLQQGLNAIATPANNGPGKPTKRPQKRTKK